MARSSRFPHRGQSQRRRVSWSVGPSGNVGSLTSNSAQSFSVGAVAVGDDLTVVRIRGEVLFRITGAIGVGFLTVGVGIAVVSQNAFGIGPTAIPHPIADLAWDGWMFHWTGAMVVLTSNAEETDDYRLVIDNKAMRKTHATDTVVAMIEVADETGAATLVAQMNSRMLSKLP